jgi:hypothetical protein
MELPSHPEADDGIPDRQSSSNTRWATVLVVAVVVTLLVVIVVLHLTGVVGPTAH